MGLGVGVDLTPRWVLGLRLAYAHLSNGQGLGDHNPALDGFGGAVRLAYSLAPRAALPSPLPPDPEPDRAGFVPGAIAEVAGGRVDESWLGGGRLRVVQRLLPHTLAILDLEGGRLAGAPLGEFAITLAAHSRFVSGALHGMRRNFTGLITHVAALQLEGHVAPSASVVGRLRYSHGDFVGRDVDLRLGFRFFPMPRLAVDTGLAVERMDEDPAPQPYVGIDWQLPFAVGLFRMSIFLERSPEILRFGVRGRFGVGEDLREEARGSGFRLLR